MSDLQKLLEQVTHAQGAILTAWNGVAHSEYLEAADALAKAADLIRDAKLLLKNPYLKRQDCIIFASGVHAANVDGIGGKCGAYPLLTERVLHATRVPTCPDCVKLLSPQETEQDQVEVSYAPILEKIQKVAAEHNIEIADLLRSIEDALTTDEPYVYVADIKSRKPSSNPQTGDGQS